MAGCAAKAEPFGRLLLAVGLHPGVGGAHLLGSDLFTAGNPTAAPAAGRIEKSD